MIYLGLDVVEVSPNAREAVEDAFHRSISVLDPGIGVRSDRARDAAPSLSRTLLWTCQSKAQIAELEAFLETRRGRLVPFWIPSRRRDIPLAAPVGASDPSVSIQAMGYARYLFPAKARRHLAFLSGASWVIRSVTDVSEGVGSEALTLSSALGVALPMDALVSQLLYCRLASDTVDIAYITPSVAEARIPFVEIPQEAP